jgi:sugar phosphate permease
MENWQSEYLQFALFAMATVWLLQRGSPESKELGKAGTESDEEQRVGRHADEDSPRWARFGDLRTTIYSNSLIIAMALVFFGSWFAQSVTGMTDYNQEQSTLQNWQSEFLAVGSFAVLAVLAVYLRQGGSPESKPVGAPSEGATGKEG